MEQLLQIFDGNTDVNTVVRRNLTYPVRTRYVRIIRYDSSRSLSYRCEFYGCPIPKLGLLPTLVPPRTDVPTTRMPTTDVSTTDMSGSSTRSTGL
jgi:hypothetical protein